MARGWKLKNVIQQKLQEVMDEEVTTNTVPAPSETSQKQKMFDDDIIITPEMLERIERQERERQRSATPQSVSYDEPQGYAQSAVDDVVRNYDDDPSYQDWIKAQSEIPTNYDESQIPPPNEEDYYTQITPEENWEQFMAAPPPLPPDEPPVHNYGMQSDIEMPPKEPKNKKPAAAPTKPQDDDIMIDADMLETKSRQLYTVKEEFLKETLDKIFARLDLPAIKYINGSDVLIETGGDAPADMILVKPDGSELKVPLGEHEQTRLDDSVAEFEQMKGIDKE